MGNKKDNDNKGFPSDFESIFRDYQPKTSPDTIFEYIAGERYQYNDFVVLNEFSEVKIDDLGKIIILFKHYKKAAEQNPGIYIDGNVILGASNKEYIPSAVVVFFMPIR